MKINGNSVNLSDAVEGLTQVAGSEVEFAVEGERVRVVTAPLLNSPQATAADLQGRLEQAGYSQFAVRFSADGVYIIDGSALEEKLDQWVINEGGRAAEAAERIRECFYSRGSSLRLSALELKTLPSVLNKLENLQELDLPYNQLTAFSVPRELVNLQQLYLSRNQLTAFSVPRELVNLQRLYLSNNQLTAFSVPSELVNLQQLDLSRNQLTAFSVPSELVNLQQLYLSNNQLTAFDVTGILINLRNLSVFNNFDLQTLPLLLGQCANLTFIDTDHTGIPLELRQNILATCQAQRDANALLVLPKRLNSWITASRESFDLTFINALTEHENALTEHEKGTINEWLTRLERTNDFSTNHQQALARIVCRMLLSLNTDPAFKEAFFTQVPVNLENCGDRAAMALNELYLSWKLATLGENATPQEKLSLMQSAAKTLALRNALSHLLAGKEAKESVEIYLYYEKALQGRLQSLTAIQSMAHADIGKRNWINEESLIKTVNDTYLNELCDLPQLKELALQDPEFAAKRNTALSPFEERLTMSEEDKEGAEGEYTTMMKVNALQAEREREEERLLREWVKTKLL